MKLLKNHANSSDCASTNALQGFHAEKSRKKPEMEEHQIIHWAKGGSSQKF